MSTPIDIDEATMALWPQALKNYGHPWREGQRCERNWKHSGTLTWDGQGVCHCGFEFTYDPDYPPKLAPLHDIPIPAVTDELLMGIVKTCKLHVGWNGQCWYAHKLGAHISEIVCRDMLDAAIILATASLEGK